MESVFFVGYHSSFLLAYDVKTKKNNNNETDAVTEELYSVVFDLELYSDAERNNDSIDRLTWSG